MKRWLAISAVIVLTAALFFSGYQLWQYSADEQEAEEQYDVLAELIAKPPPAASTPEPNGDGSGEAPAPEWTPLDQYGALFEQNADMIGWITIEGIGVDYPVMHTSDRPDYYLNHDFEMKSSKHGVPYVAEHCSIDPHSDNVTIYGHHMKSGKMFGVLANYSDDDYWREHPVIRFDTRAGFGEYEIFAVFKVNPDDFKYNLFTNAADAAEFNEYVRRCKALSFYDTGVTAKYGDKLITLSTCDNSQRSNRFVVVARKEGVVPSLSIKLSYSLPITLRALRPMRMPMSPLPLVWK